MEGSLADCGMNSNEDIQIFYHANDRLVRGRKYCVLNVTRSNEGHVRICCFINKYEACPETKVRFVITHGGIEDTMSTVIKKSRQL